MTPEKPDTQQRKPQPGIVIARPFGIPVYVSPYWFVLAGVYVVFFAKYLAPDQHGRTRYLVAAAFIVLLYASVLVHELCHSVTALKFGLPVRRILLYPLGGLSEIERDAPTPGQEFAVSGAGPGISLVLAAAGWGLTRFTMPGTVLNTLLGELAWANLLVGGFNLLPGLPLDGGRMLRAVIWKINKNPASATISAAWAGRVIAIALFVVPLATGAAFRDQYMWSTVCLYAIAAFMWMGATQTIKATRFRERIPALQARRLARKAVSVNRNTPLAEAIRRAEESQARAVVVVDHEDKPIAIVNEKAVIATPPERRPWIEAGSLARTLEPNLVLSADLSGLALLEAIRRAPASEYLLVEPSGQVYGVLAAHDVDLAFAGV
jgi:Zn-dependent protease/CBS domain-containing protein